MSAKIIDSRRYKTITKSQLEKKRQKVELNSKKCKKKSIIRKSIIDNASSTISNIRIKRHREKQKEREMLLYSKPQKTVIKEPKQKLYIPKSFIISCAVLATILVIYVGAKVMRLDEKMATMSVFNGRNNIVENKVELESSYDLKVALLGVDTTDVYSTSNLVIADFYSNSSLSLIKIKDNYTIEYMVAKNIQKVNEKEYQITLNPDYKIEVYDIICSIEKIRDAGESSAFYKRISNIKSISMVNEDRYKFILEINNEDPYEIYYLDFPLIDDNGKVDGGYTYSSQEDKVVFSATDRNASKNLKTITFSKFSNIDTCVRDFVNKNIDIFFASSNNDMQLIGKNDYNVQKYKDGETLFILGNKNSKVFSKKEVRTALMYSLNREEIVKNSDNNFIEIIDLPFLYAGIKYKYDIVGAQNIMESNNWRKNSYGIFEKNDSSGYVSATLKLLVNSNDESKVNVANNVKNMALNAGINIEIEALTQEEINNRVSLGDYDIVLATVYINQTPDVSFLRAYLDINDNTKQAFSQVENSSVEDLDDNVQNLQFVLSNEVACIGIYARNINLVYQKYISGIENLNYMKLFSNLKNIGKIKE